MHGGTPGWAQLPRSEIQKLNADILAATQPTSTTEPPLTKTPTTASVSTSSSSLTAMPSSSGASFSTKDSSSSTSSFSTLVSKTKDQVKRKLSGSGKDCTTIPDSEEEFERQKAAEVKREDRGAEYERLGLEDRTKFGSLSAISMGG